MHAEALFKSPAWWVKAYEQGFTATPEENAPADYYLSICRFSLFICQALKSLETIQIFWGFL